MRFWWSSLGDLDLRLYVRRDFVWRHPCGDPLHRHYSGWAAWRCKAAVRLAAWTWAVNDWLKGLQDD